MLGEKLLDYGIRKGEEGRRDNKHTQQTPNIQTIGKKTVSFSLSLHVMTVGEAKPVISTMLLMRSAMATSPSSA